MQAKLFIAQYTEKSSDCRGTIRTGSLNLGLKSILLANFWRSLASVSKHKLRHWRKITLILLVTWKNGRVTRMTL